MSDTTNNRRSFLEWLTVMANLGILAGLVLVALEIRQNSKLAEASLLESRFSSNIAMDHAALGEDPLVSIVKSIDTPESLTTYDIETLDRIYSAYVNSVLRIKLLGQIGVIDENIWRNYFPNANGEIKARWLLERVGNPIGRAWLKAFIERNQGTDTEFTNSLRILADFAPNLKRETYNQLRENIKEELIRMGSLETHNPIDQP